METLTVELAKELKGTKIRIYAYGYAGQDVQKEFIIGDVVSELELARNANEEMYINHPEFNNRAEYWESFMTKEALQRRIDRMKITDHEGNDMFLNSDPCDGGLFWCGDVDRIVNFEICE